MQRVDNQMVPGLGSTVGAEGFLIQPISRCLSTIYGVRTVYYRNKTIAYAVLRPIPWSSFRTKIAVSRRPPRVADNLPLPRSLQEFIPLWFQQASQKRNSCRCF
ncbi:hypothetical protein TNIN_30701 [Trichonephila inaurata madagascariensis]|uniref:Uncharacterized protein n=1 Tax=Trichonephila inaurata madagascariensis TaxID=2747483 RepID=A0A8X7C133_9ARAC|nr:hypothetical protein TNIN_30701 [Trichonephila inaurata madagascariensis]